MTNEDITPVYPDEEFNKRQHIAPQPDDFVHLDRLAGLMDSQFTIPGTSIRFGLDPLLGLIPGIGDTISLLVSGYIVQEAHRHGVPHGVKLRMLFNILLDWLIGVIPFIGDLFDLGWKANRRNVDLLRRHARKF